MFPANRKKANWTLAMRAFLLGGSGALLFAQKPLAPPPQGPYAHIPCRSLWAGNVGAEDVSVHSHASSGANWFRATPHAGAVLRPYVLEGDIENQIEPDKPKTYHAGGHFHERPMQVHRVFRNLSQTAPAKVLIFQNTGSTAASIKPLLQKPRSNPNPVRSECHQTRRRSRYHHNATAGSTTAPGILGPVFAYVVKSRYGDSGGSGSAQGLPRW